MAGSIDHGATAARPGLKDFVVPATVWSGTVLFGAVYTWLGMERHSFVRCLGCGCETGFNANDLAVVVGMGMLLGVMAPKWRSLAGFSSLIRTLCGIGLSGLSLALLLTFLRQNWWL
jgi:hypothetical protein